MFIIEPMTDANNLNTQITLQPLLREEEEEEGYIILKNRVFSFNACIITHKHAIIYT